MYISIAIDISALRFLLKLYARACDLHVEKFTDIKNTIISFLMNTESIPTQKPSIS